MTKSKVFVSFDYDNDKFLKESLIGQSKNDDSPFEISDLSIKDAISHDWEKVAREKIKRSDVVAVLCGKHTDNATGVNKELKIAQEEKTPYFLLAGYSDIQCKKPNSATQNDKMYKWTWDNLKNLINGQR